MLKKLIFPILFPLVLIIGCAFLIFADRIDYSLPEEPILFDYITYEDTLIDDSSLAIEYNGRLYLPYGTLKNRLTGKNVGSCLGYVVQEGIEMPDVRIYLLKDDVNADYLVCLILGGIMDQPFFYRALDTAGKETVTLPFIQDLDYPVWHQNEN